jgi:hypothetical protein
MIAFFAGAFFNAAALFAGAFFAGAFFNAVAFFAGAFFNAGAFFPAAFFGGPFLALVFLVGILLAPFSRLGVFGLAPSLRRTWNCVVAWCVLAGPRSNGLSIIVLRRYIKQRSRRFGDPLLWVDPKGSPPVWTLEANLPRTDAAGFRVVLEAKAAMGVVDCGGLTPVSG